MDELFPVVGGATGTDWTMNMCHSTDRGQTWGNRNLRTVTNAKNPTLAVNAKRPRGVHVPAARRRRSHRALGHAARADRRCLRDAPTSFVLHTANAQEPRRDFLPYLGDYIRLLAVGDDFYGVFAGSNRPASANFPNGVSYQRNADFTTQKLFKTDNTTPVAVSIDPFFVRYTPQGS